MLEIVKASAGAGKTYTLASRFLQLLAKAGEEQTSAACNAGRGAPAPPFAWNEILAITFTNKAAAEMQQRVLRSLKDRALGGSADGLAQDISPAQAAIWTDRILRRMGNLNIRTIDSLLHQVLRLGALQLGLPPNVELEFDARNIFQPLYAAFVAEADQGEEPQRELLDKALEADFRLNGCKRFLPSAAFQDSLLRVFAHLLSLPAQEPVCDDPAPLHEALKLEHGRFFMVAEAMQTRLQDDALKPAKHFATYLQRCLQTGLYENPKDSAYADKPSLRDCVLKASKDQVSDAAENVYAKLKQRHHDFATMAPALREAQSLAHLVRLCSHLLWRMPALLQARGVTPAARLPHQTRSLLSDALCCNEALCRMGNRLAHLLIDEFQDTSRLQWAALEPLAVEALSREGTLFYVGDVKQAIYGWRGGDASLFEEVPKRPEIAPLLQPPPEPKNLPCNWRSSEDVVDFNNRFFTQLGNPATARAVAEAMLGDKAPGNVAHELAGTLQNVYHDAEQKVAERNKGKRGFIQLEPLAAENKDELYQLVHDRLREILLDELHLGHAENHEGHKGQGLRPRDVAVLVRKNEHAAMVAKWCIEWGVQVVTENSLMLREHPLVQQMAALLAFLDYPEDDQAFWDVVSGDHLLLGACGLDVAALHQWLAAVPPGRTPLYRRFRSAFPQVWETWLAPLHGQAGFMSAYDVLCDVTARFRLLERHPADELFIRRLLETAHAAEAEGALSIAAFLELWNSSGDEQKVPLPDNLDAVRVLTIHKSKGLEFPVVIMPFHHADATPGGDLAAWPLKELPEPVLARLDAKLGETYYNHALPQFLEQINLLYVAWTRAEQGLYCLLTSSGHYRGSSPLLRALDVLLEEFDLSLTAGEAEEEKKTPQELRKRLGTDLSTLRAAAEDEEKEAKETTPRRLPTPFGLARGRPMDWLPELNIYRSELDEANFESRKRGTLVHRCLEFLRATDDPEADVRRALRSGLRGHADPHDPAAFAADNAALEAELQAILRWARATPELEPLLATGRGEQELLTADGRIRRVDLLGWDAQGAVAVEYKTGQETRDHYRQLQHYLSLLAGMPAAQRGAPPRGLLVYLDEQRIRHVESP